MFSIIPNSFIWDFGADFSCILLVFSVIFLFMIAYDPICFNIAPTNALFFGTKCLWKVILNTNKTIDKKSAQNPYIRAFA